MSYIGYYNDNNRSN